MPLFAVPPHVSGFVLFRVLPKNVGIGPAFSLRCVFAMRGERGEGGGGCFVVAFFRDVVSVGEDY